MSRLFVPEPTDALVVRSRSRLPVLGRAASVFKVLIEFFKSFFEKWESPRTVLCDAGVLH